MWFHLHPCSASIREAIELHCQIPQAVEWTAILESSRNGNRLQHERKSSPDQSHTEGVPLLEPVPQLAQTTGGLDINRLGGDVSREGKRLGGDVSRELKRFGGDISRESKKSGGDISREFKKLGIFQQQSKDKPITNSEREKMLFEQDYSRDQVNIIMQPDDSL